MGALVGHARFPLKLSRRDTTFIGAEHVEGMKPDGQWRTALMEDGIGTGVSMLAADTAGIRFPGLHGVVLGDFAALLAGNAIGIEPFHQPRQTGLLVRKVFP